MKIMNTEYLFARRILTLGKTIIANRNNNLKNINLTAEQADALIFFVENPDSSIRDLSRYLSITHQSASGIVKRLYEKGALSMTPSARDGRCSVVHLTEKGQELIRQVKENGTHTGEKILSGMSADEKDQFERLLDKALANIVKQQG